MGVPLKPTWYERHLLPYVIDLACGVKSNRDIPKLLEEAGLHSTDTQTMYLPGPRPLTYNFWGTATA